MKIIDTVRSNIDNVIKLVIHLDDGLICEVSYINKGDGKDIVCVPSRTGCSMKCQFCHATEMCGKIVDRKLTYEEIIFMISAVLEYRKLEASLEDILLVSFMGMGDPLNNIDNVIESMKGIKKLYDNAGFGLCTVVPIGSEEAQMKLLNFAANVDYKVKLHVSLHSTDDTVKRALIPKGECVYETLDF